MLNRLAWILLPALALSANLSAQLIVHLTPATEHAFDDYIATTEASMPWRAQFNLSPGVTQGTQTSYRSRRIKDGMIHDVLGAGLFPGASVAKAIALFQDYENYKNVFAPEVAESRLLSRNGNRWRTFLKLNRKKIVTAVFDTEYEVEYRQLEENRWAILSRSTRVTEVEHGKELALGTGHGYLWRLNSYWLVEQHSDGLYLECRSISLTRDIPLGLAWAVEPIVAVLPRESLEEALHAVGRGSR